MTKEEKWLLEEGFSGEKSEAFFSALTRLHLSEPLAYILGYTPFIDCTIYLDSKPLIPRVETEFWTEKLINEISHRLPEATILDLCAGSGCIGVALQKNLRRSKVYFAETDSTHLSTIEKNLEVNTGLKGKERIFVSDLFSRLGNTKFDYIATNPPYIDPRLDRVEEKVKRHEPAEALYGGEEGMEIIARIIADAPNHLNSSGQLWIEHEPEQSHFVQRLAGRCFKVTTHKDQYGLRRFSVLVLK
tara:strand:- start:2972 stop:3706 length:735 start_codon:yes stop_codon:yes gene_type:complete